ncbi:MAG: MFS transporter [Hyphomonadaceae bacterium]|nr:MFS transporter [Hyphomonadaceae bacterium]
MLKGLTGKSQLGSPRADADYSPAYLNYVLIMLLLASMFNFVDRQLLAILLEPIKAEYQLSDSQLGFLTGFAFSIFYATIGLPLAKMADQGNRKALIATAIAFWSLMTALCGFSVGFITLMMARIGVAVGEAGASPGAQSLICDYYHPRIRATIIGLQSTGVYLGVLFGFLLGGWFNDILGWRLTFIVIGLPGIVFAALFALTIKEPKRGRFETTVDPGSAPPIRSSLKHLSRLASYRNVIIAAAFCGFVSYAGMSWTPAFFIRSHGMETGEIGTWLALSAGLAGGIGCVSGGVFADFLVRKTGDTRWLVWLPSLLMLSSIPLFFLIYLTSEKYVALCALIISSFLGNTWLGISSAVVQGLVPMRMRALAFAVLLFASALIGQGMGPQLVGIFSDLLHGALGQNSLRFALVSVLTAGGIISSIFFYLASRTLRAELQPVAASQTST